MKEHCHWSLYSRRRRPFRLHRSWQLKPKPTNPLSSKDSPKGRQLNLFSHSLTLMFGRQGARRRAHMRSCLAVVLNARWVEAAFACTTLFLLDYISSIAGFPRYWQYSRLYGDTPWRPVLNTYYASHQFDSNHFILDCQSFHDGRLSIVREWDVETIRDNPRPKE